MNTDLSLVLFASAAGVLAGALSSSLAASVPGWHGAALAVLAQGAFFAPLLATMVGRRGRGRA
jgi:hypothetical protein